MKKQLKLKFKWGCKILVSLYLILEILIVIGLVNGKTIRIVKLFKKNDTTGNTTTGTGNGTSIHVSSVHVSKGTVSITSNSGDTNGILPVTHGTRRVSRELDLTTYFSSFTTNPNKSIDLHFF